MTHISVNDGTSLAYLRKEPMIYVINDERVKKFNRSKPASNSEPDPDRLFRITIRPGPKVPDPHCYKRLEQK
jgi:hypothetical protein